MNEIFISNFIQQYLIGIKFQYQFHLIQKEIMKF